MNFKWMKVATVFLVAMFLMGQTSPKNATIIYAPSNPTTATCKAGQLWQNTTSAELFGCNVSVNPPVYQSLGGAAPAAGFPITETLGAVTTTLDTDTGAGLITSFIMANATEGSGINFGLGAGLGASQFAFNAIVSASQSIDLAAGGMTNTITDGVATINEIFQMTGPTSPIWVSQVQVSGGEFGEVRVSGLGGAASQPVASLRSADIFAPANTIWQVRHGFGAQLVTTGTKPICAVTLRGYFWRVEGGAGVADTVETCSKDAADVYAWRTLIP